MRFFVAFAVIILFVPVLHGQEREEAPQPSEIAPPEAVYVPTTGQIDAIRVHPAFQYDRARAEPDNIFVRIRRAIGEWWASLWQSRTAATFWDIFPYLVLAFAIILIVLRLLEGKFGRVLRGSPHSLVIEEVTEDIHTIDFDAMIREAVSAGRWREAFRLTYLQLLKRLDDAHIINWRPEKTNHDYAREIADPTIREPFGELTGLFEYVWYGDFSMDRDSFDRASATARHLSDNVRQA